jgi:hypothetical protein
LLRSVFGRVQQQLEELLRTLYLELKLGSPPDTESYTQDTRLWDRIETIREWCFAGKVGGSDGTTA